MLMHIVRQTSPHFGLTAPFGFHASWVPGLFFERKKAKLAKEP